MNALRDDMRRQFDEVGRRFEEVGRKFEEVNKRFDEIHRRLTLIETDQKQFFTITGRLDGRIDELARR